MQTSAAQAGELPCAVPTMNLVSICVLSGAAVSAGGASVFLYLRSRKTPEEREKMRREHVCEVGRITDGVLLDACEIDSGDGAPEQMLVYSYEVAGVRYQCAQEVTQLGEQVDLPNCQVGSTTSVRYDPRHPGNSIVISESWCGLRRARRPTA
jgi:hypothetical protein